MPPPIYAHDPFLTLHQALQRPWLDLPAALLSTACEGWALALVGLVVFGARERDARRLAAVYLPLALALLASGAAVQELKDAFGTPRPLAVYGAERVRIELEPLFMFGFPSGHSSAAATFGVYALLAYGRRVRWVLALALLGGLSRIYVGAHWVIDVLGGWALGGSLGLLAYLLARWAWPEGHLTRLARERAACACGPAASGASLAPGRAPSRPRGP